MESGQSEEASRERREVDAFNVLIDLDSFGSFEDVAAVVTQKSAIDLDGAGSQLSIDLNILVDIFLKDSVSVDEIGFKILLKNFHTFWVG